MKTIGKKLIRVTVMAIVLLMTGILAMADNTQVILIGDAAKEERGVQKERMDGIPLPEETRQLVIVAGSGMDSSLVDVSYLKRNENGVWKEEFCVPGFCGYYGMTDDKKEGDRRTPTGMYSFVSVFGILPDPGSRMAYRQVEDGDFWVDDSNSRYYNQLVNAREVVPEWNSAEELIRIEPSYHYVLALDYNTAERVPGKGSAIFLHGTDSRKTWTEGCIAIPEEQVKLLVQELDSTARIVIQPKNR